MQLLICTQCEHFYVHRESLMYVDICILFDKHRKYFLSCFANAKHGYYVNIFINDSFELILAAYETA